jgi:hypothetical protein
MLLLLLLLLLLPRCWRHVLLFVLLHSPHVQLAQHVFYRTRRQLACHKLR